MKIFDTNDAEVNRKYTGKNPINGQFVNGNNYGGQKKVGDISFKERWNIFIDKVAKQENKTPNEIDEQLLAVALKKAKAGDYAFYRDTQDRVHGKPVQPLGNANGEPFIMHVVKYDESNNNTIPVSAEELPVGIFESTTEVQD